MLAVGTFATIVRYIKKEITGDVSGIHEGDISVVPG
jgi:hypothetical protein